MDIERLKDARYTAGYTTVSKLTEMDWTELREISKELIDEAITRQSVATEEVAEAIDQMKKLSQAIENDMHWRSDKLMESINLAITALQQYKKPKPDCERAERLGEWCCGYGKSEYDDEPIDACKRCDQFSGYGED